jgi:hypothetical protein
MSTGTPPNRDLSPRGIALSIPDTFFPFIENQLFALLLRRKMGIYGVTSIRTRQGSRGARIPRAQASLETPRARGLQQARGHRGGLSAQGHS